MLFNHHAFFAQLLRRVYNTLIAITALLSALILFLAFQWQKALHREHVFLITPSETLCAHSAPNTSHHSQLEISAFAAMILDKAFALNEYSWDTNLPIAASFMDQHSAQLFLSKMDHTIEALYKEHNAISSVELQHIEIANENVPYEVLLYYNTRLKFASSAQSIYQDTEAPGGLYFHLQPLQRSKSNPFGLQIRQLKFLQPRSCEPHETPA